MNMRAMIGEDRLAKGLWWRNAWPWGNGVIDGQTYREFPKMEEPT